ncbi:MAG: hypothetical protein QM626_06730 [Microbacterium sp.]|uniref:hypothetical protein n=1 Tax=Microbacterium sp. TaxID=51671 RepID=UPI0039E2293A
MTGAAIALLLVVASVTPASADDSSSGDDDPVTVTVLGEIDTDVNGSITEDDLIDQAAELGQDITDQLDDDASTDEPSDSDARVAPSLYRPGNDST